MAAGRRVHRQPAFVLARHPYAESSLIIDAFTREHGRVALLAKGARRLKSPNRGLLQAFVPLAVDWSGRRELVTLTRAEPVAPYRPLSGRGWMCGWYANELVLRFVQRADAHEGLFDAYERLVARLADGEDPEWSLRLFETALLRDVGYGLVLAVDGEDHAPIQPGRRYRYVPGLGPVSGGDGVGIEVAGETLLALGADERPGALARREAKRLTRALVAELLEGRGLRSRQVFLEMYRAGSRVDGDEAAKPA